ENQPAPAGRGRAVAGLTAAAAAAVFPAPPGATAAGRRVVGDPFRVIGEREPAATAGGNGLLLGALGAAENQLAVALACGDAVGEPLAVRREGRRQPLDALPGL